MTAFDGLAVAFANVLGVPQDTAMWLLGIIAILAIVLPLSLASRDSGFLLTGGVIGAIFDVLAGWWPLWTMLVLVIIIVWLIVRPLHGGGT